MKPGMHYTWEHCTMKDLIDYGANYLYAFMCDYERYNHFYGFISVADFLRGWKCVTPDSLASLKRSDNVYDAKGVRYKVTEDSSNYDDCIFIEVIRQLDDGSFSGTTEMIAMGDVYSEDVIHDDFRWKKRINRESEETICPILITKTNQPQS